MERDFRVGLVGLDSPHAVNFAQLLNDEQVPHHVTGAKVVAGFPGGSEDFERSWSRVEGNTQRRREEFAVQIMDSPEAVAMRLDELGISYRSYERRLKSHRGRGATPDTFAGYRFDHGDVIVEATVFPVDGIRQAPISPIDGKPMRRANRKTVENLTD